MPWRNGDQNPIKHASRSKYRNAGVLWSFVSRNPKALAGGARSEAKEVTRSRCEQWREQYPLRALSELFGVQRGYFARYILGPPTTVTNSLSEHVSQIDFRLTHKDRRAQQQLPHLATLFNNTTQDYTHLSLHHICVRCLL